MQHANTKKSKIIFQTLAKIIKQEREKQNIENPIVHDTEKAIKTAIEAIKILKG